MSLGRPRVLLKGFDKQNNSTSECLCHGCRSRARLRQRQRLDSVLNLFPTAIAACLWVIFSAIQLTASLIKPPVSSLPTSAVGITLSLAGDAGDLWDIRRLDRAQRLRFLCFPSSSQPTALI
jgi:hypothetical protein